MLVYVVADSRAKLGAIPGVLGKKYEVVGELLDAATATRGAGAVIINADLRIAENISALKRLSCQIAHVPTRVFIVDQRTHLSIVQAYALGATKVLANPIKPAELLAALARKSESPFVSRAPRTRGEEVASAGAATIASMFSAVVRGSRIDVAEAKHAGGRITDHVAEHGMSDWLEVVRRHHEGAYQHCLLVTGIAADFGLNLGMAKADIDRLHSAAIFHDIGKAMIPLAILDKPGKLDARERALIETHPAAGYKVLLGNAEISAEILDAVRNHHEYLDGSGYPDGLAAENISDLVRILTISDIFAALIEHRSYKPAMPRDVAYQILLSMTDKLEQPLVDAFRNVALNR